MQCSSSSTLTKVFPPPQKKNKNNSLVNLDCLVTAHKMNYPYHLEFKLHVCRFLVLGFILMLVTISYLHINYKDKVQFHQRMTYSYVKPHVASLRIYFLLWCVAYLPWWHIVSHLIKVCFKESKLKLLRGSVVSV